MTTAGRCAKLGRVKAARVGPFWRTEMPAEFESGVFTGKVPAWHGLGTVLSEDSITMERALVEAGLSDWGLEMIPAFGMLPSRQTVPVPSTRVVYRAKDGAALGAVGDRYELIPNEMAFEWCEALVGQGARVFTAGSLRGGRVVWALFRPPFAIELPDSRVDPYILVSTSHDGSMAVRAAITPIRVVCQNTLTAALQSSARQVRIRHFAGAMDAKMKEAREVLGVVQAGIVQLGEVAEEMVAQPLSFTDFVAFLDKLVPVPDEKGRGQTLALQTREKIGDIYREAPGQEEIRDTAWGAYNAVVEYWDHQVPSRLQKGADAAENRAMRIWFGANGRSMPERAIALLR